MTYPALHLDSPAIYRIRVEGNPCGSCLERLDDWTIVWTTHAGRAPVAALSGRVSDQGDLIGVLNDLLDQGSLLLSVECLAVEPAGSLVSELAGEPPVGEL